MSASAHRPSVILNLGIPDTGFSSLLMFRNRFRGKCLKILPWLGPSYGLLSEMNECVCASSATLGKFAVVDVWSMSISLESHSFLPKNRARDDHGSIMHAYLTSHHIPFEMKWNELSGDFLLQKNELVCINGRSGSGTLYPQVKQTKVVVELEDRGGRNHFIKSQNCAS